MEKVGIVSLCGDYNMGNRLQFYAVMRLYRSLGYDVTALVYDEQELFPESPLTDWIKSALKKILPRVCPNLHPKLGRRRLFLDFAKSYLSPSQTVSISRVPLDLKKHYDFFSVGSDQVWHNWDLFPEALNFFFLKFADKRQRLCLSPSFGLERVSEEEAVVYREGLNGFPRLSCREASGVRLIRALTGRDAELLSDPTMCLTDEEWTRLERKPSYPLPERYVLSYMLGVVQRETTDAVSRYVRLLRMDIVNINDTANLTEHYAATGPREFLYLIRHASLICTNSFHGMVFSILFRRNFVCFKREDVSVTGDMSNRAVTLLEKFHLSSRRYGVLSDEDLLSTDYAGAVETLPMERERIRNYLRKSIADADSV